MNTRLRRLAIFISLLWSGIAAAQCPSGYSMLKVVIVSDNFPTETSWTIKDMTGDSILWGHPTAGNSVFQDSICIENDKCLIFEIKDRYGDGICCSQGMGS